MYKISVAYPLRMQEVKLKLNKVFSEWKSVLSKREALLGETFMSGASQTKELVYLFKLSSCH